MRKKDLLSFKFSGKLENKNHRSISTTKKLLITLKSVFDSILKQADLKSGDNYLNIINNGIENLTSSINDKKPYEEAMKIIHGIIQPALQEKFNLALEQSLSTKPSNNTKEHLSNMTVH